jgi:hypothetical protein
MVRRLLIAPLLAAVFATASPATVAVASCVAPRPLADQIQSAAVVFVGTVVYTSDGDRQAHVKVESIWKGSPLAAYVDVDGSPVSGPFQASSIDRRYQTGVRYLFVLYSASQPFQDNSCSATQQFTPALTTYAPPGAKAPLAPTLTEQATNFVVLHFWPLVAALVAIVVLAVIALWRRRPTSAKPGDSAHLVR